MKNWQNLQRHPWSCRYPADQTTIETIALSMTRSGYRGEPIRVLDGEIIDGYHRQQAAIKAGVTPTFEDVSAWSQADIEEMLHRRNGARRSLTKTQHVLSLLLSRGDRPEPSDQEICRVTGAAKTTFEEARRLWANDPDTAAEVQAGKKAFSVASPKPRARVELTKVQRNKITRLAGLAGKSFIQMSRVVLEAGIEQAKKQYG